MPKNLVSGAEFIKFDNPGDSFTGCYLGSQVNAEKDDEKQNRKAGDTMGYNFQTIDGEVHIVPNNNAIEKVMQHASKGVCLQFTYKSKADLDGGREFKRFKIDELETGDDGYFTIGTASPGDVIPE
jgi:hypothetical protein